MRLTRAGTGLHRDDVRRLSLAAATWPRSAQEIAAEFSTALLRGLIRDEATRVASPWGPELLGS